MEDGEFIKILKFGNVYNSRFLLDGIKFLLGYFEGIFDVMGNIYKGVVKVIRK